MVEAGQAADGRGTTIWNGNRSPPRPPISSITIPAHSVPQRTPPGDCASVFYVMETLPGSSSVTQELIDR